MVAAVIALLRPNLKVINSAASEKADMQSRSSSTTSLIHTDTDDSDSLQWREERKVVSSVETKRCGEMESLLASLTVSSPSVKCTTDMLSGKVVRFALNKVGCEVISNIFPRLDDQGAQLLLEEVVGEVFYLSEHKYGCRAMLSIFSTCLNRPDLHEVMAVLVDEVVRDFDNFVYSVFGHRLLMLMLEIGTEELQGRLVTELLAHPHGLLVVCFNQDACEVVALAVKKCCQGDVSRMANELLADGIESLTLHVHSIPVLAAFLKQRCVQQQVRDRLLEDSGNLAMTKRGRSLARHYSIPL